MRELLSAPLLPLGFTPYRDNVDGQWNSFSGQFGSILFSSAIFVLISRLVRHRLGCHHLPRFYALAGVGTTLYMHGTGAFFMFVVLLANFACAKIGHSRMSFRVYMAVMWVVHISTLYSSHKYEKYLRFGSMSAQLAWLDDFPVLYAWNRSANFAMLRMISFDFDLWESCARGPETAEAVERRHRENCADCALHNEPCYRLRVQAPRPLPEYCLTNYLAFTLYIPLYLAGPIVPFNAFLAYTQEPQRQFGMRSSVFYGLRMIGSGCMLTVLMHFAFINAIGRTPAAMRSLSPLELSAHFYLMLGFVWLKFNTIWKFYRLVALADGVGAPENMKRCYCDVTLIQHFWRDWHATFNQWIVRYLYVPVGGSKRKAIVVIPIFLFVAFWHETDMSLVVWGLFMAVGIIPELAVQAYFARPQFRWLESKPYYRLLRVAGGTLSGVTLLGANVIGFGIGAEETYVTMQKDVSREGCVSALFLVLISLFSCNIGVYYRDHCEALRAQEIRGLHLERGSKTVQ